MIRDDIEPQTTTDRIRQLQAQVAHFRWTETNPVNDRACTAGFLAEIDRMQLGVRRFLNALPVGS